MPQLKLCIIFGGKSEEHAISLISANGILNNLNSERYSVQKIGITRDGQWLLFRDKPFLHVDEPKKIALNLPTGGSVVLDPNPGSNFLYAVAKENKELVPLEKPDIVFPILHGPFGEDGKVQGLLDVAGIPYVGTRLLGCAIGMDKAVTKELLQAHGLPVTPSLTFHVGTHGGEAYDWKKVSAALGTDLFVKPVNLGSSVGISHVKTKEQYTDAIDLAFKFDSKILVEKTIRGRELESAVLGNLQPKATRPGEIKPRHDFYSYEAKYIDPEGAELFVPANVKASVAKKVQEMALAAFTTLGLRGLARIDFFYDEKAEALYINEVNTMPGFTPISMYPKLWELEGVPYSALLDRLIDLGLES